MVETSRRMKVQQIVEAKDGEARDEPAADWRRVHDRGRSRRMKEDGRRGYGMVGNGGRWLEATAGNGRRRDCIGTDGDGRRETVEGRTRWWREEKRKQTRLRSKTHGVGDLSSCPYPA